jgi:tellurite resistance protein TerB
VLEAVEKIADDAHAARLLVRVCVAIGKSDEDFSDSEKAVIGELCDALSLERSQLGL